MDNRKIKRSIDKITKQVMDELTYELALQIERGYENVIQRFYNDYDTKYYNRTYNTYTASDSYHDYLKAITPIPNGYQIGIHVSSENIDGNPYYAEKDWVFNNTFIKGIHGSKSVGTMSPSPKILMDRWFDLFKQENNLNQIASQIIQKTSQKILQR